MKTETLNIGYLDPLGKNILDPWYGPLLSLEGSEDWPLSRRRLIMVLFHVFISIPNWGCIPGDRRIYIGQSHAILKRTARNDNGWQAYIHWKVAMWYSLQELCSSCGICNPCGHRILQQIAVEANKLEYDHLLTPKPRNEGKQKQHHKKQGIAKASKT